MMKKAIFGVIGIIFIAALAAAGYFYYQYLQIKKQFGIQAASIEEVKRLTVQIGKLMLLPSNESPTIATVTDITKLKGQAFFANAVNGDKVLIYTGAKEAILYDPKKNMIINVAPVNLGGNQPSQTQAARIGIRNGTDSTGLAAKTQSDIQKAFPGANVVFTEQGKRTDYNKTIVVALNDPAKSAAGDLAKALNGVVGDLPTVETKPSGVDILIIAGKDRL